MNALLMMVPLVVASAMPGYKHVGGANGVEVYRQMQSPDIDLVAEGDIDAPPSMVRGIVLDYANAHSLSDHVAESKVLSTKPGEMVVYQRLKLPVVADRDFTLRALWGERGGNLWTRYTVDNARGPEARDQIVRVSTLNGGWDLMPIRGGSATHAVYRVRINLAGSIPRWMVSGGAAKDLPKLFEGVRHQAQRQVARAMR
ncbi:MAG: Collagenase [Myxococcales bacterium]|nr:Collagenase [Myxococcales bacterium]